MSEPCNPQCSTHAGLVQSLTGMEERVDRMEKSIHKRIDKAEAKTEIVDKKANDAVIMIQESMRAIDKLIGESATTTRDMFAEIKAEIATVNVSVGTIQGGITAKKFIITISAVIIGAIGGAFITHLLSM
jgi:hypothetical protein